MNRIDWSELKRIFAEACELGPEERSALLDKRCAGKPELRAELDVYLRQHEQLQARPAPQRPSDGVSTEDTPTDVLLGRLKEHSPPRQRYQLRGEIARGGMGAILKVWDENLRRDLAMKVVLGKTLPGAGDGTPGVDPQTLGRFLEEAQVTGQLDHPGIVPVHELGLDNEGRVFFTMKLVKGRDLKDVFKLVFAGQEGWNETRALGVILKACEAMAYAHAKGVIHRDLKPANVMVGNFGEVYVMDWGIARVQGRKDSHDLRIAPELTTELGSIRTERREERDDVADSPLLTRDGDVLGTPAYMAPEQARGEIEQLGPRSDVYSMGAMLYHLLARHAPYLTPGARIHNRTLLAMVLQGPPAPLASLRDDLPQELVAICEKAMAREASQRYADTLALAEDLRAFLEHRVVGAYETGAWAEARKWVQRNRPLAAAIAAALLAAIGGLAWVSIVQSRAREDMARKNVELAAATKTARANEELAEANESRAKEQEALATKKSNDVLSLSAIQELKELEAEADTLWPANPELVPAYERWLEKAHLLVKDRAGDQGPGNAPTRAARPSLADHEDRIAKLRLRANPRTPRQVEDDRERSPSFAEWNKANSKLVWMRRMLGEEPWPAEAEVEADLARGMALDGHELQRAADAGSRRLLPTDAKGLNQLAWPLVDPDPSKIVYGSEVKALALARRALAAAKDEERALVRDTLAWALFRCGRIDEALAEEQRGVEEAQGSQEDVLTGSLKELRKQSARWISETARAKRAEEAAKLAASAAALEPDLNVRLTYDFDDPQDRWWHTQLAQLVAALREFKDERAGGPYSSGTSKQTGWGIVKRAEFARAIAERSVTGAEASKRWAEALDAISHSTRYREARWPGGKLPGPQMGLLPIGADSDSGLWEFAHLQTGEPPQRGADGKLVLTGEMGLVFVLIPGGTFWMGAQKSDPQGRNYEPPAQAVEAPVHKVTLTAYFLSKYEMTQGQWRRFVGQDPSLYGAVPIAMRGDPNEKGGVGLHPVEQVTWNDCMTTMRRLGLELPTEAQWEFGCRGSTSSAYWSGNDPATLVDAGNVADQYAKKHGGESWPVHEAWDDGHWAHAAVGSYRANAFGLHDVHGNVWEWCLDPWGDYPADEQVDPVSPGNGAPVRVSRGGCFAVSAAYARSAYRIESTPELRVITQGLRPARTVRP